MQNNRSKLFASNIIIYGLGGSVSKLIPLIMVPIITRLMPNSFYYGMSDLTTTIVSLFSALAVMGMYDAMYRMFFEKNDSKYKKEICSTALFFTMLTSIFVFLLMILLRSQISKLFYSDSNYGNLVMVAAASVLIGATNSIVSAPTRMQNQKIRYLLGNILSPIISYSIAIPLILNGYYLYAVPISGFISALSLELLFFVFNNKFFSFKSINWKYIKSMLVIALPLLPNFIIYWIFNSSDRVMITYFIDANASGVYAVASKIGHISNLVYVAFAAGWQYFAFSIMRDKDSVSIVSKIFEVLTAFSLCTCILLTSISKIVVEVLFPAEYLEGYMCIPYLYLAPLLFMLFQIGTNQFITIRKTWPNLIIISFGAIINIFLNIYLIKYIGIEGASIATFVGYFVSILLSIIVMKKMKLINLRIRYYIMCILFLSVFVILRYNRFTLYFLNISLALIFCIIIYVMYRKDLIHFLKRLFKRKNKDDINVENDEDIDDKSIES